MSPVEAIRMAWRALTGNWLRSVLTMLGMIIGVAAVIATFAIGVGAQTRIDSIMQQLGANMLVMWPGQSNVAGARGPSGAGGRLSERDVNAIRREAAGVDVVAGSVGGGVQAVAGNLNWQTRIQGVTNDFLRARDWEIADGRAFTEAEELRGGKVVILGQTVATQLFGDADPLGQIVRLNRVPVEVVGVTVPKGQTPFGQDQDDFVFVPLDTARQRILGRNQARPDQIDQITIKAFTPERLAQAEQSVKAVMDARNPGAEPGEAYNLRNVTQFLEAQTSAARTMSQLLGVVATIALIVGGIGIMNIMLVSVTERTREIGLRMAVGARRADVRTQFLFEAVTLALAGGSLGIALGIVISIAVATLAGWPLIIAPWVIGIAFAFSAAIGIFFGWYPAAKAARLDPIEALRYE